jgi:hypothetical protein
MSSPGVPGMVCSSLIPRLPWPYPTCISLPFASTYLVGSMSGRLPVYRPHLQERGGTSRLEPDDYMYVRYLVLLLHSLEIAYTGQ